MSDERLRDMQTDLIILGARGKALVVWHTGEGFGATLLERPNSESAMTADFTGKTLAEVTGKARSSAEGGPW